MAFVDQARPDRNFSWASPGSKFLWLCMQKGVWSRVLLVVCAVVVVVPPWCAVFGPQICWCSSLANTQTCFARAFPEPDLIGLGQ